MMKDLPLFRLYRLVRYNEFKGIVCFYVASTDSPALPGQGINHVIAVQDNHGLRVVILI